MPTENADETDYQWETKPMYRDGTSVQVGTVFHFDDDQPTEFYYDASGEEPDLVAIEFDDSTVMKRLDHPVIKAIADDGTDRLTKAVAVTPDAKEEEIQHLQMQLHPEFVGE